MILALNSRLCRDDRNSTPVIQIMAKEQFRESPLSSLMFLIKPYDSVHHMLKKAEPIVPTE